MRPLVLVPTYNERDNLPPLVEQLLRCMNVRVMIVDDASPDGTGELADRLAAEHPDRLFVLHRAGKEGLGKAYIAGFHWGLDHGYDLLFEMDADFSHEPRHLPQFINAIRAGADVVLGSRYIPRGGTRNWSLLRRLISRGGSLYAQIILGLPFHDLTGGFKCFRRRALEAIDLDSITANGYGFQIEVTYRCYKRGLRIVETPIVFVDRRVGQSKMSRNIVYEAMWMVWKLRLGR